MIAYWKIRGLILCLPKNSPFAEKQSVCRVGSTRPEMYTSSARCQTQESVAYCKYICALKKKYAYEPLFSVKVELEIGCLRLVKVCVFIHEYTFRFLDPSNKQFDKVCILRHSKLFHQLTHP